jgi:predicted dienelactone hydrolase
LTLLAGTGAAVVWYRAGTARLLSLAAMIACALHLILDGWRWQMSPAYLALIVVGGPSLIRASRRTWPQFTAVSSAATGYALAALLAWQLPIVELPEPDGPHDVGTTRWSINDHTRADPLDPARRRDLVVEAWYPGDPAQASAYPRAPFWNELHRGPLDWVSFFFKYLGYMPSQSRVDLPAEERGDSFPLILYNHSLAMFTGDNTLLMEHLASHGYVVVSVSHPGYGLRIELRGRDPQIIDFAKAFAGMPQQDGLAMRARLADAATREERAEITLAFAEANHVFNRIAEIWVDDTVAVLNDLAERSDERLGMMIDTERVGSIGMSFGGAVAAEFCKKDRRCAAGINIDGTQYGLRLREPLNVPFLMLSSADGMGQNEFLGLNSNAPFYDYVVADAKHADFTDFTLIGPLVRTIGFLGSIPGERMLGITQASVRSFLDREIKGLDTQLAPAAYPEIAITSTE